MTTEARETIARVLDDKIPEGVAILSADDVAQLFTDALPEIIARMVKPLVWEGEEADCFVFAKAGFCEYQISVVDTLDRSCDHIWNVDFRTPSGRDELIKCKGAGSLQDVIKAANAHNRATILKDLGLEVANA